MWFKNAVVYKLSRDDFEVEDLQALFEDFKYTQCSLNSDNKCDTSCRLVRGQSIIEIAMLIGPKNGVYTIGSINNGLKGNDIKYLLYGHKISQ